MSLHKKSDKLVGVAMFKTLWKGSDTSSVQQNYYSDDGKDTLARRGVNPAPAHYKELRELNPPLQFMNASGKNKPRITSFGKKSKA
jgi:hypothetical protein